MKPEEVDVKEAEILRKQKLAEERKLKKKAEEERKLKTLRQAQERKQWGFIGRWCPRCRKDELQIMESAYGKDDTQWPAAGLDGSVCISKDCSGIEGGVSLLSNEERRAQLQAKVEDLKHERLRKAQAKDRWKNWKATQQYNRAGAGETDYLRWSTWMPSDDEEDELPPAPPPDTPEFRAMEADIDRRAADKVARRRAADALREEGNAAREEGRPTRAVRLYTRGLEHDKGHRGLLTNRALACLKLDNRPVKVGVMRMLIMLE